jgi:hypothetical protein
MMRKILFIFNIIGLTLINGYCQHGEILLKNKISNKEQIIKEGKKVSIVCKDSKIMIGRFHILNDSVIFIDNESCSINEIIQINKGSLGAETTGMILTCVDGLATYLSLSSILIEYMYPEYYSGTVLARFVISGSALLVGLPATIIGSVATTIGILKIIRNRKYYSAKWNMKIVIN